MTGDRFEFGKNWASFLASLDEERIKRACESVVSLLGLDESVERPLDGQTFLDLGCGSGLFSLAAYRLGAEVTSIDFDRECIACTEELRVREDADRERWVLRQGSAIDAELMRALGHFDVVYSWGVLHHTGDMQRGLELAAERVSPSGTLALAIYNDQGGASRRWLMIKKTYHRIPSVFRSLWVIAVASYYEWRFAIARLINGRNPLPFSDWKAKRKDRGMSAWHDWVDWIGGLPFEVATPEAIILPMIRRGFRLSNLSTVGAGWGCNQFVFCKSVSAEETTEKACCDTC